MVGKTWVDQGRTPYVLGCVCVKWGPWEGVTPKQTLHSCGCYGLGLFLLDPPVVLLPHQPGGAEESAQSSVLRLSARSSLDH